MTVPAVAAGHLPGRFATSPRTSPMCEDRSFPDAVATSAMRGRLAYFDASALREQPGCSDCVGPGSIEIAVGPQVRGVNVPVESTTPRVPPTLQSFSPALVPEGGAASGGSNSDPSVSRAKSVAPVEST